MAEGSEGADEEVRRWSYWNLDAASAAAASDSDDQHMDYGLSLPGERALPIGAADAVERRGAQGRSSIEELSSLATGPNQDEVATSRSASPPFTRAEMTPIVPETSDLSVALEQLSRHLITLQAAPSNFGVYLLADRVVYQIRHVWLSPLHFSLSEGVVGVLADICDAWYLTDVTKSNKCKECVEVAQRAIDVGALRKSRIRTFSDCALLPHSSKQKFVVSSALVCFTFILNVVLLALLASGVNGTWGIALASSALGLLTIVQAYMALNVAVEVAPWSLSRSVSDFSLICTNPLSSLSKKALSPAELSWERHKEGFLALRAGRHRRLVIPAEHVFPLLPVIVLDSQQRIVTCTPAAVAVLRSRMTAEAETPPASDAFVGKQALDVLKFEDAPLAGFVHVSLNTGTGSATPPSLRVMGKVERDFDTIDSASQHPQGGGGETVIFLSSGIDAAASADSVPKEQVPQVLVSFAQKRKADEPLITWPLLSPSLDMAERPTSRAPRMSVGAFAQDLQTFENVVSAQVLLNSPSSYPFVVHRIAQEVLFMALDANSECRFNVFFFLKPGTNVGVVSINSVGSLLMPLTSDGIHSDATITALRESSHGVEILVDSDGAVRVEAVVAEDILEHSASTAQRSQVSDRILHVLLCSRDSDDISIASRVVLRKGHSLQVCGNADQALRLVFCPSAVDVVLWNSNVTDLSKAALEVIAACCRGSLFVIGSESGAEGSSKAQAQQDAISFGFVHLREKRVTENIVVALLRKAVDSIQDEHQSIPYQPGTAASMAHKQRSLVIKKKIGSGTFGDVYEAALEPTGGLVALKRMELPGNREEVQRHLTNILKEVSIMSRLSHPNIVCYLFAERQLNTINIAMELCDDSLDAVIKNGQLQPKQVSTWMMQLLDAVQYLHDHRIIHRDLKPLNILLRRGVLKVGDFGCAAREVAHCGIGSIKGTLAFMAPEVLLEENFGSSCDIWSVGAVFARIIGIELHKEAGFYHLASLYRAMPLDEGVQVAAELPPGIAEVLRSCLQRDPRRRLSAAELKELRLFRDPELMVREWQLIPRHRREASVFNMSLTSASSARAAPSGKEMERVV